MPSATLLVVDDNAEQRSVLGETLRRRDFAICEAANGADGIAAAIKMRPSLIILDVVLPDQDGYEICRLLKADAGLCAIPVLLVSGLGTRSEARVQGLDCGADGYLAKPVDPDELVAQVRALLRLRQAEERASNANARLAAIVESSDDAIVSMSCDGAVLTWNPGAQRLFGHAAEEMIGRCLGLLVPADTRDEMWRLFAGVCAGNTQPATELVLLTKDQRQIDASLRFSAIRGTEDRIIGVAAILHDVTERKRLELHVQQSQKMQAVGQLAGGIAHDFNNHLTVINGCAELAVQQLAPGDALRQLLEQIRGAGARSASLTQQLLAFSRKQVLAPRILDVNAVVAEMEQMLRRLIGEDIEFRTNLHPDVGSVRADPGQFQQVLVNLAVNARDAMPQGGKLTVETRNARLDEGYAQVRAEVEPGPYVLLAVSDTGCGMTPEIKARIFEPFFTTKGPGTGTGLGLATVFGIVKQSGGHIEVYSEPGLGATFKVYLPRVKRAPHAPPSHQGLGPAPGGHETILLVEDDDAVRALSKRVLEQCGYQVLEAADGAQALQCCRQQEECIDLLVTDVVIPGLSGRHLAERIIVERPHIRVLYVSGYTDDAVVRHGILHEQANFLQKPFSPTALARKVRDVLDATK